MAPAADRRAEAHGAGVGGLRALHPEGEEAELRTVQAPAAAEHQPRAEEGERPRRGLDRAMMRTSCTAAMSRARHARHAMRCAMRCARRGVAPCYARRGAVLLGGLLVAVDACTLHLLHLHLHLHLHWLHLLHATRSTGLTTLSNSHR